MITAIVPIIKNKTGDTSDRNNYRPIALVTACSKIWNYAFCPLLKITFVHTIISLILRSIMRLICVFIIIIIIIFIHTRSIPRKNTTYNSNDNRSIYTYYEVYKCLINLYKVFLLYHLILNEKLY